MLAWFGVFAAQFLNVGLRAFQQRNVAFDNYAAVLPTSCGMAMVEVYIVSMVAKTGWEIPLVTALALGAATGCITAMRIHKKWLKNSDQVSKS